EEERKNEIIKLIGRTAIEAESLVNRVLELDKSQHEAKLQVDHINIIGFMEQMIEKMQSFANKKGIKINIMRTAGVCNVNADKTYLNLIFENLISNAIKFSPSDSTIRVMVTNNMDNAKVSIMDDGPGITTEEVPLLFKKFSKLSPRPTAGESSTGLGLALVKRYIELVDGDVYYDTEAKSKGSTFVVILPLA
ncbi:MAG: HAMP domain-containing sensor histidine kinase, partial [Nitrososphaeraceae archaeon]|nr:HAMP domain-containing sensor histidine kinase [Nitrososphaeraceae archaeon]